VSVEAFTPIVESLLGRPLDSPEFADALEVAGPLERAEALRQIAWQRECVDQRQAVVEKRIAELSDELGLG
jgi:hypothetical protein